MRNSLKHNFALVNVLFFTKINMQHIFETIVKWIEAQWVPIIKTFLFSKKQWTTTKNMQK